MELWYWCGDVRSCWFHTGSGGGRAVSTRLGGGMFPLFALAHAATAGDRESRCLCHTEGRMAGEMSCC